MCPPVPGWLVCRGRIRQKVDRAVLICKSMAGELHIGESTAFQIGFGPFIVETVTRVVL